MNILFKYNYLKLILLILNMNGLEFYKEYHSHPTNKLIHFICIPLICLTTINLASLLKFKALKCTGLELLNIFYFINYFRFGINIGTFMFSYLILLNTLGKVWRILDNKWKRNTIIVFIIGWILQFIGHYIEGRKPALFDSIIQSFLSAPLFSLDYILHF